MRRQNAPLVLGSKKLKNKALVAVGSFHMRHPQLRRAYSSSSAAAAASSCSPPFLHSTKWAPTPPQKQSNQHLTQSQSQTFETNSSLSSWHHAESNITNKNQEQAHHASIVRCSLPNVPCHRWEAALGRSVHGVHWGWAARPPPPALAVLAERPTAMPTRSSPT
jgi:hypothetical protein